MAVARHGNFGKRPILALVLNGNGRSTGMIIVDRALQARAEAGNPVRVGMIGAGFMGRGIANQIANSVPGMELVAIFNRNLDGAKRAYTEAGITDFKVVNTVADLEAAIAQGQYAVTD